MRILLLRPPRYVWPFNSETSAFWQPLGILSLAAAVRRETPQAEIVVWEKLGTVTNGTAVHFRLCLRRHLNKVS